MTTAPKTSQAPSIDSLRLNVPERHYMMAGHGRARLWKLLVLVLLVLLGLGFFFHRKALEQANARSGTPVELVTVTASRGLAQAKFTAGGWIEPAFPFPVSVTPLVSGRVDELLVKEGDDVEEGAVLARLYSADVELAIEEASARLDAAKAREARVIAGYRLEEKDAAKARLQKAQAVLARLESGALAEQIAKARAEKAECEVRARSLEAVAGRSESLLKSGAISRETAEKDRAEWEAAKARVAAADAWLKVVEAGARPEEIDEAQAEVDAATAELERLKMGPRLEDLDEMRAEAAAAEKALQLAQARLDYTDILAPRAGRVLQVKSAEGMWLTGDSGVLLTIYDPGQMQARVDVRQENIAGLETGQPVKILTDARRGEPYGGVVLRIDPLANLARDMIRLRVRVDNPDNKLYPDMTATVEFLDPVAARAESGEGLESPADAAGDGGKKNNDTAGIDDAENPESAAEATKPRKPVLAVPQGAIVTDKDQAWVFRVLDGKTARTMVKLGASAAGRVVVVEGLKEGDVIVASNAAVLSDGEKVRLRLADEGTAP